MKVKKRAQSFRKMDEIISKNSTEEMFARMYLGTAKLSTYFL